MDLVRKLTMESFTSTKLIGLKLKKEWEMVGEDLMVALLEPNTIQLVDDSDQTEIASM